MLTELTDVPQVPGEPPRRWFTGGGLELIVWLGGESEFEGFRLCYGEGPEERALSWFADKGFSHQAVDAGEDRPAKHKMAPVLVADGLLDRETLLSKFHNESAAVDPAIVELVEKKISEYDPEL